jgi:hypothetical protein
MMQVVECKKGVCKETIFFDDGTRAPILEEWSVV